MAACFPQEDTIEKREGHASHWAGAEMLMGRVVALGQVADNDVTLSDEMIDAATMYANHIMARGRAAGQVERLVKNAVLHPDNYGTPDHWHYDAATRTLWVDDFKYGHKYVSVVRNWQLINYAALILFFLGLYGESDITVNMTIIQPRCYHRLGHIRTWEMSSGMLVPYWRKLSMAFEAAMKPDAPCIASDPDECDDCEGRFACEAHIAAAFWGVEKSYQSAPLNMTPAQKARHYKTLQRAEKFIKAQREGIAEAIESDIRRGIGNPLYKIDHGKGRVIWLENAVEQGILDVAAAYNVKIDKPALVQLVTPTQAIKAKLPEEIVKAYSHSPGGKAELVEVDPDYAANIFNT